MPFTSGRVIKLMTLVARLVATRRRVHAPHKEGQRPPPTSLCLIMETLNSWINLIKKRALFGENLTLLFTKFNVNFNQSFSKYNHRLRGGERIQVLGVTWDSQSPATVLLL
jgi:hypothetical protein